MAAYKFVNADQLDADLTTVADAIRAKGDTSAKLSFPHDMKAAVDALSGLNFTVVSGTTAPASPTENMIWVNMTTKVADYLIGTEKQANPVLGSVWIVTGATSQTPFAATKDGTIIIYPIRVERFTAGTTAEGDAYANWGVKEAKIWKSGQWKTITE